MTDFEKRYPSHPGRRRLRVALTVLLAVAGLAWTLWTASVRSTPEVVGRVKSFEIVDDFAVRAVLQVDRRTPSTPVTCRVFAQATNYERVGEVGLDVTPGHERVTDVPVSLKTFRRGTTVVLQGCEVAR